ncbi:MAG: GNAT family N-acetyltransferase [Polyangiaceae bacterium]
MLDAAHLELLLDGHVEEVVPGGADERTWLDCDLASLAENRIGDMRSPIGLSDEARAAWESRVTLETTESITVRAQWERCYWLKERGERTGTVALASEVLGDNQVRLTSLYVLPSHRGRGVGERAMRRIRAAFARQGLGLRLDTHWAWSRAVRFYLRLGMWLSDWRRELTFFWDPSTPDPQVEIGPAHASLSVRAGGEDRVLARASRRSDVLVMDDRGERFAEAARDERFGKAPWSACSTLCLAIAAAGWPLVRSPQDWDRAYHVANASPEGLAHQIQIWEAWDLRAGFDVSAPRIAGLSYPTWEELSARWAAEKREFDPNEPSA